MAGLLSDLNSRPTHYGPAVWRAAGRAVRTRNGRWGTRVANWWRAIRAGNVHARRGGTAGPIAASRIAGPDRRGRCPWPVHRRRQRWGGVGVVSKPNRVWLARCFHSGTLG